MQYFLLLLLIYPSVLLFFLKYNILQLTRIMEGCKAFSSKIVPARSVTSGVFTSTKAHNVGNIATRHSNCPPSDANKDIRNSAIRYDIGTFKESLVMVKNSTGCYVLPESYKHKVYKKKPEANGNGNGFSKRNDIPTVYSHFGHYLSPEEFTVKTPAEFKSDVKEEFSDFVLKNGYVPGSPVHFSWSEIVKANTPLTSQYKPNVKGRVPKGNSYIENRHCTVPMPESNSGYCNFAKYKGTEKREFNPHAKEWIPKSKIIKNMPITPGISIKGKTETKPIGLKVKGTSEYKLMGVKDKKRKAQILIPKELKNDDKSPASIAFTKENKDKECGECINGVDDDIPNHSNDIQIPNSLKVSINTSTK